MKKSVLLVFIAVLLSAPSTTFGFGIEFALGAWLEQPSGTLSYDSSDDLSLDNDLGYDDKWQPTGRLKIDMPFLLPNIYLMYTPMKWSETGNMNTSFNFGDDNFQANVDFKSTLKMDHLDIALYYGLPGVRTATADVLNIDLGLNFRLMDFKAEINQPDSGLKQTQSYFLPIPMAYGAAQIAPMDWIAMEFEGRASAYKSNHYLSLIGRLKIKPFGPLFVAGGYRYDSVKIDYQDVDVDTEFRGPFAEAGFDF
jgi:outer membrane protein